MTDWNEIGPKLMALLEAVRDDEGFFGLDDDLKVNVLDGLAKPTGEKTIENKSLEDLPTKGSVTKEGL